jgi:hypothetical protein
MVYIGFYVMIELMVAVGLYMILPRRFCIALGGIALLLGIAAPLGVWGYANLYVSGDPSGFGMLGTLMAILFAPGGIALTILGLMKAE